MRLFTAQCVALSALGLWAMPAHARVHHLRHLRARTAAAVPAPVDAGSAIDAGAAAPLAVDGGAQPGPESVSTEAAPQARFGAEFPYTIRVTHAPDEVVALPRTPDFGDYDLVTSTKQDLAKGHDVTTVFSLTLRAWTVGKKAIGQVKLDVQSPSGERQLDVAGPTVEVLATMNPDAGEAQALRDIAPPVDLPVPTYRLLWALLAALGLGGLAYAVVRQLQKPRVATVAPPPPLEPAHVRARRALEALLAEDLAGRGRQRELYFRLSEIIRRYLGERFGFDAIDLTTFELLAALRKRPTPGLDLAAFARSCEAADMVKFAKLQPDANDCKGAIDDALSMVAATRQPSVNGGAA